MVGGKRAGAGRPPGATGEKKERISITVSKDHKKWLESKDLSYAKTISRLINAAIFDLKNIHTE